MNEKRTDRAKSLKCTLQQNVCGLESGLCVRAMKAVDDAANVTASVDTSLMEENMNTMMGRIKQLEEHATIIQKTWRMFSGAKVWRCNDALSEKDTTEGDSSSKEASPSEYSDSSASSSESSDDEFDVDELDQAAAADHYEGMAMRTRGAVALALVVVLAVAVALARQSKP